MGKLDGKVTIVTGCARGIGKGIALLLGSEGAKVACADRDLKDINVNDGCPILLENLDIELSCGIGINA